ncbi:hypothetical protein [Amycolatopsis eburnea]|uniref:ANTAR domain-containing protein n=1 Tax=Amycolatopsis eburnea TaxID=2267691 RepID=A0A427TQ43_9PSEU|nr:hypothetical protein [Amycolatopsis eburnea]RSD26426.1 hypothetical protein EIY87_00120 [Amycolatopsis eburnea]
MSLTPTPAIIARDALYALHGKLGEDASTEQLLQLGMLAAQVEIADRLEGIEKSLDIGLLIRTE